MGGVRAKKSRVVIVGAGRLGGALAAHLHRAKWPVKVLPRSDAAVRRVVKAGLALADLDDLARAQIVVLAVPDAQLSSAAKTIEADLGAKTALVHCAGALGLDAFGPGFERRSRGSLHPLAAISDPDDGLPGHAAAVAASTKGLRLELEALARAVGLRPFLVPEVSRPAYHAGAVLAAGLSVALLDAGAAALGAAGLSTLDAVEALLPLMRSALRGVEHRGLSRGLTGPLVRGDVAVVEAHLAALPADVRGLYLRLSRRALRLAAPRLPSETVRRFEALFGAD